LALKLDPRSKQKEYALSDDEWVWGGEEFEHESDCCDFDDFA